MGAVRTSAGFGPGTTALARRTQRVHLGASAGEASPRGPSPNRFPGPRAVRAGPGRAPAGGDLDRLRLCRICLTAAGVVDDGTAVTLLEQGGGASVGSPDGRVRTVDALSRVAVFPTVSAWGYVAVGVWTVFPPDRLRFATLETP